MPFEALQSADDRYLIDRVAVSYAPSLSGLRELTKPRGRLARSKTSSITKLSQTSTAGLAAFGNPRLSKDLVKRVAVTYNDETLPPAPERGIEIERLKTVYGAAQSRVFAGAEASEQRAKLEATRSGVLHFATPVILADSSPMYTLTALAPGESPEQDDGLLQNWEIINLHSRASLVVLSDSSVKRPRAGEAIIALEWSWFAAGTPSLLLSRWEVQTPGATQLMAEFHARLRAQSKAKRSLTKAEALRQSALTLRRSADYGHPYYWSGFALMGDRR